MKLEKESRNFLARHQGLPSSLPRERGTGKKKEEHTEKSYHVCGLKDPSKARLQD
jgi:hypothetical protein